MPAICDLTASSSLEVSCWPIGAEVALSACGGAGGVSLAEAVWSCFVRFFSSELKSAVCCGGFFGGLGLA